MFQENFKAFVQNFSRQNVGGGLAKGTGGPGHFEMGRNGYQHFAQLAMLLQYHQSILKKFLDFQVETLASFEYLALPKMTLETTKSQFRLAPSELQKTVTSQVKQAVLIN